MSENRVQHVKSGELHGDGDCRAPGSDPALSDVREHGERRREHSNSQVDNPQPFSMGVRLTCFDCFQVLSIRNGNGTNGQRVLVGRKPRECLHPLH